MKCGCAFPRSVPDVPCDWLEKLWSEGGQRALSPSSPAWLPGLQSLRLELGRVQ